VNLNNPIPYPGTELFEIVKKNHWFLIEPEIYLNYVTENEGLPVFETPEIPKNERIELFKKMHKIEKQITRKAVQRMYNKYSILGLLAGVLFATDFVEKMFFKNRLFRRIIEQVRYKRMLRNKCKMAFE
jgi:ferritin